jgi:hypothetical protein
MVFFFGLQLRLKYNDAFFGSQNCKGSAQSDTLTKGSDVTDGVGLSGNLQGNTGP